MPKTSYALRYAIRSHRIDVPDARVAKPNACNLCHLDRTLTWAATEIARLWGGAAAREVLADEPPASVVGLLAADAAERVIWADAFGDRDAMTASASDWETRPLATAEHDPYAVIRFIAHRSTRTYPNGSQRELVTQQQIDTLVAHRDNRDVYVAE